MRLQTRMLLNHFKKLPHLIPVRKHVIGKNHTQNPPPPKSTRRSYSGKFMRRRRDWKGGLSRIVNETVFYQLNGVFLAERKSP
jgi:hypothetical protein